jgi:hypothetical protein
LKFSLSRNSLFTHDSLHINPAAAANWPRKANDENFIILTHSLFLSLLFADNFLNVKMDKKSATQIAIALILTALTALTESAPASINHAEVSRNRS